MARPEIEIKNEIAQVHARLEALPDSAVRMGLDEDYLGQLDALEDELKDARECSLPEE